MIESFNCPNHAYKVMADSAEMSSNALHNFRQECSSDFCF